MGTFKIADEKIKIIFKSNKKFKWSKSHSWVPTILPLNNKSQLEVLYGSRNNENLTQTGKFIYDLEQKKVTYNSNKPLIKLGKLGNFDDSLALVTSAVKSGKKLFLYYVGWTRPKNTRFFPSIGLAILYLNKKKIVKLPHPIRSREEKESLGCASPCVLKERKKFKMWYVSIRKWITKNKSTFPIYNLSYSESVNGKSWNTKKINILNSSTFETISRPFVMKYKKIYHMWYSVRKLNSNFKIGYAYSKNGLKWKKRNNFQNIPKSNWNSKMSCYPCVFKYKEKFFMLLNGNDYGKRGIGLLELKYEKK